MADCAEEHHARKVGLGETGDTALTGKGRPHGGNNFLQGGGSRNPTVWVIDVGPFGVNGEKVRGDTHGFPATDHGTHVSDPYN